QSAVCRSIQLSYAPDGAVGLEPTTCRSRCTPGRQSVVVLTAVDEGVARTLLCQLSYAPAVGHSGRWESNPRPMYSGPAVNRRCLGPNEACREKVVLPLHHAPVGAPGLEPGPSA